MKKIALINIPDSGISGKGYTVPLGLAYIGAALRKAEYEVRGYDLCISRDTLHKYYLTADPSFLDSILAYCPDFIGMTCTTTNRHNLSFWAGVFKEKLPGTTIIVGGPHPFFIPMEYMKSTPSVDILVLGEGERVIVHYLETAVRGQDLKQVRGIAFRRGEDIFINETEEVIEDLDEIDFPARDLFPVYDYDMEFGTIRGKAVTIITSRGCGSRCKFCSTSNYWKKVRFRSAKNVVDEIEAVIRQFPGIENIVFFDDTLTSNRNHAVSICREITSRNIKINWACWSRTNIVDDEFFQILKEAGCTTLSYGIESGNDEMLQVMRKQTSVSNNIKALINGRKFGICTRGTMIAGMPEEKFAWALDSIFFIASMTSRGVDPGDLRINLFTFIFPGTPWEKWFRERYPDFSWDHIPAKYRTGSITDSFGNIVLPCYKWKGAPYTVLSLLLQMIHRFRFFRQLIILPRVQKMMKKCLVALIREYPRIYYDD